MNHPRLLSQSIFNFFSPNEKVKWGKGVTPTIANWNKESLRWIIWSFPHYSGVPFVDWWWWSKKKSFIKNCFQHFNARKTKGNMTHLNFADSKNKCWQFILKKAIDNLNDVVSMCEELHHYKILYLNNVFSLKMY